MRKLSRKNFYISLILSLTACVCLFAACRKTVGEKELPPPINIRVEEETLLWNKTENAVGYLVDIDGRREYEAESNSLDVFVLLSEPDTYEIRIKAVGDGETYLDSSWSQPMEYTSKPSQNWVLRPIKNGAEYEAAAAAEKPRGKVVIPSVNPQDGKPITRLARNAFLNCTELTGIVLSHNLQTIGVTAFSNCTKLTRVHCPATLSTIESSAFYRCGSLTEINLPDQLETLGRSAFSYCSSLTNITIPSGLTELEGFLFSHCSALTEITIPRDIEKIGITPFEGTNLSAIAVEEGNPVYKSDQNCIIHKADNVLIAGCKTSVIPDYVETIGEGAFEFCQGLTEITVPAGVRKIDKDAFANCRNLTSITLSEGLKEIVSTPFADASPFRFCINLTALEIPASVEFIPEGLTSFCQNLSKLTVKEGNPVYKSDGNCILRKSDNQLVAGCKTSVIPAYVKRIGPYAFQGCSFTSIVIPEGVEKIGSNAFTSSQLTEITLPNTLTTIEVGAFSSCEKLHSKRALAIPESVKEIQQGAFLHSPFLIVLLPDSVETIGSQAFFVAHIYTSASPNYPEGWHRGNPAVMDFPWAEIGSSEVVYNCKFGYDDGRPYMDSCVWTFEYEERPNGVNIDAGSLSLPIIGPMRTPVREGYTFMGWTTEKGSDKIAFDAETAVLDAIIGNRVLYLKTEVSYFPYEKLKNIPIGTVLYARWVPDK